jgi:hypothetical protein
MDEQTAGKFAELLGKCAATGDSRELVKQAGLPEILLASLAGAGVGGAAGYFGTEKEKNKARNAAYGALTGGLGAGGLQTAYHYLGNSASPDINGSGGNAGGGIGAALAAAGATAATPFKSLGNFVGASLGAGAANVPISGRSFATRMADRASNLYERVTGRGRYSGELSAVAGGAMDAKRGKGVDDSLSKFFKDFFGRHGANAQGRPVSHSLDTPAPNPGRAPVRPVDPMAFGLPAGHPDVIAAAVDYNQRMSDWRSAVKEWLAAKATFDADRKALPGKLTRAEGIVSSDKLGDGVAERAKNLRILAEMHKNINNKKPLPDGFLLELERAYKGPKGYRASRGAARVGGTVAGSAAGMGVNYALETLLNYFRGKAAE